MLSLCLIVSYPTKNKILAMAHKTMCGLTPASPSSLISYCSLPGFCAVAGLADFSILWTCQTCFQLVAFAFAVSPVLKGPFIFLWLALALHLGLSSEESYLTTTSKCPSSIHCLLNYPVLVMVFITEKPLFIVCWFSSPCSHESRVAVCLSHPCIPRD